MRVNSYKKIINYNHCKFSDSIQNWQDFRYQDKRAVAPSWCHGASGIALSYLTSKQFLNLDFDFINWGKIGSLIIKEGFNSLHCLCHGMIGNAEAVIAISNFINKPELKNLVKNRIFCEIEENNKELKWRTGFTNGKYSLNGLLLGTSGIGYGLLNIFLDEHIPSILTLEPPKSISFLKSKNDSL